MRLTIHYFALLRDQRGLDSETIDSDAGTPRRLYETLSARHGFTLPARSLKVAINDEFAPWETALADGDTIVFIPPVAGG